DRQKRLLQALELKVILVAELEAGGFLCQALPLQRRNALPLLREHVSKSPLASRSENQCIQAPRSIGDVTGQCDSRDVAGEAEKHQSQKGQIEGSGSHCSRYTHNERRPGWFSALPDSSLEPLVLPFDCGSSEHARLWFRARGRRPSRSPRR